MDLLEMDAHSLEQALVLRFFEGNQRQRKIVQLKGLSKQSDTSSVARLVFDQCKPLIPSDRFSELERLIFYLQQRHILDKVGVDSLNGMEILAKMENLENYMELLYEEGEPKQRGVALLAELVRHVEATRLAQIVENEQLMGALTRVWREDSRKNFELAIHLAQLFHRLSQFVPFHATLSHLKIGLLCVQMVEFELGRWELWREQTREMEPKERHKWEYAMRKQDQLIAVVLRILLNLADDLRAEHKMLRKGLLPMLFKCLEHNASPQLLTVAVKFLWKLSQFAENQQHIGNTVGAIDRLVSLLVSSPKSAASEGGSGLLPSSSSPSSASPEFLSALCSLLFNCSFESSSRRCMVNAGLVSLLAPHISENDVALALMYQLSIVDDAKAMVAFTDCIPVLLNLLWAGSRPSSAVDGRTEKETKQRRRQHSLLTKSLLVNIVLEKRNSQLLCGSEGQGLDSLMAFALENDDGDILAMKIARNIASHEGPTRDMFIKWVPQLLENAIDKTQPSTADSNRQRPSTTKATTFALECMAICAQLPNAPWTQLEDSYNVVAFLARILGQSQRNAEDSPSLDVDTFLDRRKVDVDDERTNTDEKDVKEDNGTETSAGTVTDEVILQAVQWCATLAMHSIQMADKVEVHLLPLIVSTLNMRQNDDEIVLQCVFVFLSLLAHGGELAKRICFTDEGQKNQRQKSVRKGTDGGGNLPEAVVPLLLLNLMHDRNPQMRALCEQTLGRVAELNAYWRERVREAQFRWHNAQWLEMVQNSTRMPPRPFSTDHSIFGESFMTNEEVEQLIDGGHVLNTEQLLNGTEF